MKGQMFILTIIFLIGLIYTVQQGLTSYSLLDFTEPFEENDFYTLSNVREMFERTVATTETCAEAEENLNELVNFFGAKLIFGGFIIDIGFRLDCADWDNVESLPFNPAPVNLTLKILGSNSEAYSNIEIYHQVPPTIYYAKYWNPNLPDTPCSFTGSEPYYRLASKIEDLNGDDITTVEATITIYNHAGHLLREIIVTLYDDGDPLHEDAVAGDNIYNNMWDSSMACTDALGCTSTETLKAVDENGQESTTTIWCLD